MFILPFFYVIVCGFYEWKWICADFLLFVYICIVIVDPIITGAINWFNPATFLHLSQVRTWIYNAIFWGLIIFKSLFEVRGGCLFYWYWWNGWPSLFKLSFHSMTMGDNTITTSCMILLSLALNMRKHNSGQDWKYMLDTTEQHGIELSCVSDFVYGLFCTTISLVCLFVFFLNVIMSSAFLWLLSPNIDLFSTLMNSDGKQFHQYQQTSNHLNTKQTDHDICHCKL